MVTTKKDKTEPMIPCVTCIKDDCQRNCVISQMGKQIKSEPSSRSFEHDFIACELKRKLWMKETVTGKLKQYVGKQNTIC